MEKIYKNNKCQHAAIKNKTLATHYSDISHTLLRY